MSPCKRLQSSAAEGVCNSLRQPIKVGLDKGDIAPVFMLLRANFTLFQVEVRSSPIVYEHSVSFSKAHLDLLSIIRSTFFILEGLGVSISQKPCGKQ